MDVSRAKERRVKTRLARIDEEREAQREEEIEKTDKNRGRRRERTEGSSSKIKERGRKWMCRVQK